MKTNNNMCSRRGLEVNSGVGSVSIKLQLMMSNRIEQRLAVKDFSGAEISSNNSTLKSRGGKADLSVCPYHE